MKHIIPCHRKNASEDEKVIHNEKAKISVDLFKCKLCQKSFPLRSQCVMHIESDHSRKKDKTPEESENKNSIPYKKSIHEGNESYECMLCSEKFVKKPLFTKHSCKPYDPENDEPNFTELVELSSPRHEQSEEIVDLSFEDIGEDSLFIESKIADEDDDFFELNPYR